MSYTNQNKKHCSTVHVQYSVCDVSHSINCGHVVSLRNLFLTQNLWAYLEHFIIVQLIPNNPNNGRNTVHVHVYIRGFDEILSTQAAKSDTLRKLYCTCICKSKFKPIEDSSSEHSFVYYLLTPHTLLLTYIYI